MCRECQNLRIKPREKHNMKKINEQCDVVLKARSKKEREYLPRKDPVRMKH